MTEPSDSDVESVARPVDSRLYDISCSLWAITSLCLSVLTCTTGIMLLASKAQYEG